MRYQRFKSPDIPNLEEDQVEEYIDAARKHYSEYYQYHNWDHATATIRGVDRIADKLSEYNVSIARNALRIAAAWHDAGYHENHAALDFLTKEDYSAALLDRYMEDKPVDGLFKNLMHSAIVGTWHLHPEHRTPPQVILHRADTANIGGPADEFINNNLLLFREAQFRGLFTSWDQHVRQTDRFVRLLVAEHEHESLLQNMYAEDTTVDVYDERFRDAAIRNLEALYEISEP